MSSISSHWRYRYRWVSHDLHSVPVTTTTSKSKRRISFIAIMLGRLRISVEEAIEEYIAIVGSVSGNSADPDCGQVLEEKLKNLVERRTGDPDTLMISNESGKFCRRCLP